MHLQVFGRRSIRDPAILDQAHSLKLELSRNLPPLHDAPPAPSKHLTRCLRNRVQANQHQLWSEQVALLRGALHEVEEEFTGALEQSHEVECPMCGQRYRNHIADQFELLADKDELLLALQT